jgi:hypothetical protein
VGKLGYLNDKIEFRKNEMQTLSTYKGNVIVQYIDNQGIIYKTNGVLKEIEPFKTIELFKYAKNNGNYSRQIQIIPFLGNSFGILEIQNTNGKPLFSNQQISNEYKKRKELSDINLRDIRIKTFGEDICTNTDIF